MLSDLQLKDKGLKLFKNTVFLCQAVNTDKETTMSDTVTIISDVIKVISNPVAYPIYVITTAWLFKRVRHIRSSRYELDNKEEGNISYKKTGDEVFPSRPDNLQVTKPPNEPGVN